jgi:hypothetical protein
MEQHNGARGLGFAADSLAWDETVPKSHFVNQRKVSYTNRVQ